MEARCADYGAIPRLPSHVRNGSGVSRCGQKCRRQAAFDSLLIAASNISAT